METNNQSGLPESVQQAISNRARNGNTEYWMLEGARIALQNQSGAGEKVTPIKVDVAARNHATTQYPPFGETGLAHLQCVNDFKAGVSWAQSRPSQQPVSESREGSPIIHFDINGNPFPGLPPARFQWQSIPAPVAPVQLSEEEAGKLFDDYSDELSYTDSGSYSVMTREHFIKAIQSLQFPQQEREAVEKDANELDDLRTLALALIKDRRSVLSDLDIPTSIVHRVLNRFNYSAGSF